MPKKGKHPVGVARQYCGQLGKRDNCQVAVRLSAANDHASLPIAYRLYLPQEWGTSQKGVAAGHLAGRDQHQTRFALRGGACASRAS